jgi:hypothetical protein
MIHAYDTLMDSLAALAVEAVCTPTTAVQSYWLILVAQQHISGASLTLGGLLRQAQGEAVLPMPHWARPFAAQALERLWREGVWWEALQRYPAMYQGLPLAAWLERLTTLLAHLETLPYPTAYQFDP